MFNNNQACKLEIVYSFMLEMQKYRPLATGYVQVGIHLMADLGGLDLVT